MILKSFRVTEFRSVQDSGWINVEQITALIGTNESGKTNILLPLWKLNPAEDGAIDLKADLPRDKYHIYRNADPKPVFIRARYKLLETECVELATLSGNDASEFEEIIISKDYGNNLSFEFPCESCADGELLVQAKTYLAKCVETLDSISDPNKNETARKQKALELVSAASRALEAEGSIADRLKNALEQIAMFSESVASSSTCAAMAEISKKIKVEIKDAQRPTLNENKAVIQYIETHMPKYVYYSNYGNLDSQIHLPTVLANMDQKNLGAKEAAKARTLKTLFRFVKLNPQEITNLGAENTPNNATPEQLKAIAANKDERGILLSSAASDFTKQFNEWWKQGNYTFEFKADGNYFRIWVSDTVRPEPIELEARSTGLQWFFSFYLVFLVESEQHHRNAILLLDEPGVTLHPLAQKDLFMFFENLGQSNQMMYTTHSPFMVDSNHLERVRSIYMDTNGKTVASPDLRASEKQKGKNQPQSIYPAHAALGLSISDTLLINCNPVLVEGESDQVYLSALKNLLISKGKISPLKEIVFITTGGVKGIKATSAILTGVNEAKPSILLDGDKPGKKTYAELKSDFYAANQDKLICVSEYTNVADGEIEDLLPKKPFARIITRFLPRPEEVENDFEDVVVDDAPICNQVESYAKQNGIQLDTGWKVRLATMVKKEILKGKDKVVAESDPEFERIVALFKKLL